MTNEEAIHALDTLVEAYGISIRAIRAQIDVKGVETETVKSAKLDRSRWEGCKMCTAKYSPTDWNRGGSREFRVDKHALFYQDSKFGWAGKEIKFCPMCGRPLTEEAWAELERKIGGL